MTRLYLFALCTVLLLLAGCGAGEDEGAAMLTAAPITTRATRAAEAVVAYTDTPAIHLPTVTHTPTLLPPTNTPTATTQPTETATNTPIPLPTPPPPGEIVFLWSPEPEDDLGPLPQNLYFAKFSDAAGEWEMETTLTDLHGAGLYLSPDGTKFAVRLFEDTDGNGIVSTMGTADYSNVYLYPLSDKTLTRLTDTEIKGTVQVSWLPDNQQFTYTLNKDIFLFDLANSTSTQLLSFPGLITFHQWSPDGRWLAIVSRLSDEPAPAGESHRLDLYDTETNNLISVVSKLGGSSISWSPSSQWFAFSSIEQGLYVTSINDLVPIQLDAGLSFPSWSPDGQWLAFTSQTGAGSLNLWNPNTQLTERLLEGNGRLSRPIWSPDNQHLAIALNTEEESSLLVVDMTNKTTNTVLIGPKPVPEPGPARWPLETSSWSPDGQWILFEASGKDNRNFSVVNYTNGEVLVVLDFTGTDIPEDVCWLP